VKSGLRRHSTVDLMPGVNQILPSQFRDLSGSHRPTAEQRLMTALLADAINVFQKGFFSRSARQRMLYLDAERWILGRANGHGFSFETACDALGIDPALLRRRLVEWKHAAGRGAAVCSVRHLRIKFTPREQRLSRPRRASRASRAI
jgi:hypothetical protein